MSDVILPVRLVLFRGATAVSDRECMTADDGLRAAREAVATRREKAPGKGTGYRPAPPYFTGAMVWIPNPYTETYDVERVDADPRWTVPAYDA